MDLLTTATLASMPAYAVQVDMSEYDQVHEEQETAAPPAAAPSSLTAREVQARMLQLAAQVERTERHLRALVPSTTEDFLPDADVDVALRMPRGPIMRRKGILRLVKSRTTVVSPTAEEMAHLSLGDEANGG